METLLLIAGIMLLCGGIVCAFSPKSLTGGCAAAYLGVTAVRSSHFVALDADTLLFWAVAVMLVLVTGMLGGNRGDIPRIVTRYIAGGALAGMMAGVAMGSVGALTAGSVCGALLGTFAVSRTSSGRFYGRRLWRMTVEGGLPAVVTMTQAGLVLAGVV